MHVPRAEDRQNIAVTPTGTSVQTNAVPSAFRITAPDIPEASGIPIGNPAMGIHRMPVVSGVAFTVVAPGGMAIDIGVCDVRKSCSIRLPVWNQST